MPRRRSSASPTTGWRRTCSPPCRNWSRRSDRAQVSSGAQRAPFFSETRAMSYRAPLKDMLFDIESLAGIEAVSRLPGHEEAGLDTARAVLEECARLTEDVIAPLNREGDKHP